MSRTARMNEIPTWLKHKPIYAIRRYEGIDGLYKNDTDVIGLSLGKAQWCNGNFVPSVKVWRDVRNEESNNFIISRQSEETTLTRALDLATLVVKVYDAYANNKPINEQFIETVFGNVTIETVGSKELLDQLRGFLSGTNLSDIKTHIEVLKKSIENLKL